MNYNLKSTTRNTGALNALKTGEGVCEDYANLFVALCRAQKIPARMSYGINAANKIDLNDKKDSQYHAWAEFYIPEYGWIYADPTMSKNMKYTSGFSAKKGYADDLLMSYKGDKFINFYFDKERKVVAYPKYKPTVERITDYTSYVVKPYSSYSSRLDDSTKLVEKAEKSLENEDKNSALSLVNTLHDSIEKTDLLRRIKSIPTKEEAEKQYKELLAKATKSVEKAETTNLQTDVDSAKELVNSLKEGDRPSLNDRLDKVQQAIDKALKEQQAKEKAEKQYKELLAKATKSVEKAETTNLQADVDSAKELVNSLKEGDRPSLNDRLDIVQKVIIKEKKVSKQSKKEREDKDNIYSKSVADNKTYSSSSIKRKKRILDCKKFRVFKPQITDDLQKTWTIEFNKDLDPNYIHEDSIYIVNDDYKIDSRVDCINNKVLITPKRKMDKGIYGLIVERVYSKDEDILSLPIKMMFEVK